MTRHRAAAPSIRPRLAWLAAAAVLGWAGPASPQILGGQGPLGLPGPAVSIPERPDASLRLPREPRLPDVGTTLDQATAAASKAAVDSLAELRRARALDLLRRHPRQLEADERGEPVVRGEILALGLSPQALVRAQAAGFSVRRRGALEPLGLDLAVLGAPRGVPAIEAVRRLRALDPTGVYDFNHLYLESGRAAPTEPRLAAERGGAAAAVRIGLLDGGVARHPSLGGSRVVQRGFGPGGLKPSAHGTAVASLLAGRQGRFHGAAPGASLYVADVYGAGPTGGSAAILAQALAWTAANATPVVNVSLVGPANLTLAAAVKAMVARGHLIVAAVGNDGPAAPPLYPAAYPGVVAVSAVDARGRLLPEAGRAARVDFVAPGSDMAAAALAGGYAPVRGTSFAAPLVAGRLALLAARVDPATAGRALAALGSEAADLGVPGPDAAFGRGLVAAELRVEPAQVRAAGRALSGP